MAVVQQGPSDLWDDCETPLTDRSLMRLHGHSVMDDKGEREDSQKQNDKVVMSVILVCLVLGTVMATSHGVTEMFSVPWRTVLPTEKTTQGSLKNF
jgi:hypothetical protein